MEQVWNEKDGRHVQDSARIPDLHELTEPQIQMAIGRP